MDFLKTLKIEKINNGVSTGNEWISSSGELIDSISPVDGEIIGFVKTADKESYEAVLKKAASAYKEWRLIPAPKRGEIVRQIGDALRLHKDALGKLVSYEMGKSLQEATVKYRR